MAKVGRPTKYKPEFCNAILKFFDVEPYREVTELTTYKDGSTKETIKEVPCDLPLFGYFAVKVCDVPGATLNEWCKVHPEFHDAYKKAKELQTRILVVNAIRDNYAQAFSIFTSKNILDWRDRSEILEVKYVYEFVGKITQAMNKVLPDTCPHCRKALSLREETIRELEAVAKSMDEVKAA